MNTNGSILLIREDPYPCPDFWNPRGPTDRALRTSDLGDNGLYGC